ncbi:hypothetical protein [Cellulomonas sp. Leaf395]|uniref:hypothetical protein n=1 Tax=Cellulomonas sp. Leaf395 TaxID=1736362 RepID=UPI0012FA1A15|nr:hypothetical protein [Cellulomonas sp. Leaf395]
MSWHSSDGANGTDGGMYPAVNWSDDDALAAELADALIEGPLYDRVLAGAAIAFRTHRRMVADDDQLDFILLSLVHDSRITGDVVGVRDRTGGAARTLVFQGDDLGVEVEVQPDAIDGQLIPPRPGQITVHAPEGVVTTVETDEVGCFRVELEAGGLLRLECKSAGSRCVTEWFPW